MFTRLVHHIENFRHNIYKDNRYLIYVTGGMGDTVYATICKASALKKYNNIEIDFFVKKEHRNIVGLLNQDSVVYYCEESNAKKNEKYLKRLNNKNILVWNMYPPTIGIGDMELEKLLFNSEPNLNDYYFDNNNSFVINKIKSNLNIFNNKKTIGICLTSPFFIKCFSYDNQIRIFNHFKDYNIINFGKNIIKSTNIINICNRFDFYYLPYIIKLCKFLITIDTGPMHIACITRTPFYAFFNCTDPNKILKHVHRSNWNNFMIDCNCNIDISLKEINNYENILR